MQSITDYLAQNSYIVSLLGMFTLILIAIIFSYNRRGIRLRTVGGAFALQFGIGAFVLYMPDFSFGLLGFDVHIASGQEILKAVSTGVGNVINYGNEGINFLFGGLVGGKMFEVFGGGGFVFALRVLPMIIFFSSLIAVLYYLGVMQVVIRLLGGALHHLLGTSRAESMSAAANIFVGQTEAPLVVKPFIKNMTQSELFAIMCGGLASVAGSVLAGYASMGVPLPYLIAASFMAAPGGLLFAKLIFPETEEPLSNKKMASQFTGDEEEGPKNVIDAAATGASTGMQIALNVGAMLLAFIALIAMLNGFLGLLGDWYYGLATYMNFDIAKPEWSLEALFSWLFAPLAWLIGATGEEVKVAAQFIGQKLAINEFYAYAQFSDYLQAHPDMSAKSQAIVAFALCGFANFSSIAILVGGLAIMAPSRRSDVARMGLKALLAGTLSNLMSATIAGLFIGLVGAQALGVGG